VAERRLSPDEAEIWAKVAGSVRRLESEKIAAVSDPSPQRRLGSTSIETKTTPKTQKTWTPASAVAMRKDAAADTLDGGWDRRLRKGLVRPDRSVDLHGHNLVSAFACCSS
jgi:DNA-nicking Smr family endonuclease